MGLIQRQKIMNPTRRRTLDTHNAPAVPKGPPKRSFRGLFISLASSFALALLLGACSKKGDSASQAPAAVPLVQVPEQSRHFAVVNSHLELGGALYGYVDVDGDMLALAGSAQSVVRQVALMQPQLSMFAKQDFKALMVDLGLDDVKAIGLSSVHETGGAYRNRVFLYTPQGRHGLFAIFGGQPGKFVGASLAPQDADFFAEHEFDVMSVYQTIKGVVGKVNGPEAAEAFEKQVKNAGAEAHFSLLDMVLGLNGRATFILRLDPVKNMEFPGPKPAFKFPSVSALVRVDGIGPAVEAALAAQPAQFEASEEGSLHLFTSKAAVPIEGLKFIVAIDGKALYLATSPEFLHECLKRTDGLDKNPEFVAALAALGPEGNGLTWVTPRFFSRLRELPDLNQDAAPQVKKILDMYVANFPAVSQPMLSVRTNLPDGILIRSTWNRSLKADVAMLTIYNPLTVGLVAAMAIPAFQKVRANSQAMAVMNNLRMLSAAADQYYIENHVRTATYDDLVGPGKYVKAVVPVAGEDYRRLVFAQGVRLTIRLPDGRAFSYPVDALQPGSTGTSQTQQDRAEAIRRRVAILRNLKLLEGAANSYYAANGATTATYAEVMGADQHPDIRPVVGEDYSTVVLRKGLPLQIRLPDGSSVRLPVARPRPRASNSNNGELGAPSGPQSPSNPQQGGADDAIMANLRRLNDAANQYYEENDATSVTLENLVGPGRLIPQLVPVAGEDYRTVLFKKGHPLRIFLKDGRELTYPP